MPLDVTEEGVILSTKMDDSGEVLATIEGVEVDGQEAERLADCRILQPLGLRSRPRDNQAGCHFAQNGDEIEILHCSDRDATDALGSLDAGTTQIHSVGPSPQAVEVKDNKIKVGKNAQKKAARVDDEVEVTLYYTTTVVAGSTVVAALSPTPPGTPLTLKGRITKGSDLVDIE